MKFHIRSRRRRRQLALQCLENQLIIFLISGYLPGEYCLRVFPLICKATQSCRLSLSLLGRSAKDPDKSNLARHKIFTPLENEGPIYGIYSRWRDLRKVFLRGHSVTALRQPQEEIDYYNERENPTAFSCIETLHISNIYNYPPSMAHFPKLKKLQIDQIDISIERLLDGLWTLPLTSLIFNIDKKRIPTREKISSPGPPVFAQTLVSLETAERRDLLDILSPYCRGLRTITTNSYHKIIANNTALTSLSLLKMMPDKFDLTSHTRLVMLVLCGYCPVVTSALIDLKELSLETRDAFRAKMFMRHCPALRHVSLRVSWGDVVMMIEELDPQKCKQLTLELNSGITQPTVEEVYRATIQRGFRINEEFLLDTSDVDKSWERILEIAPQIKSWQILNGVYTMDVSSLASFSALSVVYLFTSSSWDQHTLSAAVKSCSTLKDLTLRHGLGSKFSGNLELESQSLYKLKLNFLDKFSTYQLRLPKLEHLSIENTGDSFLSRLLNDDPSIHLPILRTLNMGVGRFISDFGPSMAVSCETGHQSLTHLRVNAKRNISNITLQYLPSLKSLRLCELSSEVCVQMDLPGECDVYIGGSEPYRREGDSSQSTFKKAIQLYPQAKSWVLPGQKVY